MAGIQEPLGIRRSALSLSEAASYKVHTQMSHYIVQRLREPRKKAPFSSHFSALF